MVTVHNDNLHDDDQAWSENNGLAYHATMQDWILAGSDDIDELKAWVLAQGYDPSALATTCIITTPADARGDFTCYDYAGGAWVRG